MHSAHLDIRLLIVLKVIRDLMMNERRERKHVSAFKRRHKRVTVSIDEFLLVWLDDQVTKRLYHSRSHGIEVGILGLKREHAKDDKRT
jgi:hypothetical protein